MSRSTKDIGARTKSTLLEDIDYLIRRVAKIRNGNEKGLDARSRPIRLAMESLHSARRDLDAALVESVD